MANLTSTAARWIVLIALALSAVGTQVALEGRVVTPAASATVPWVQSPTLLRRLTLGFNTIWADVYWIRAVQYFGGTRLSRDAQKQYDLLYPLLDITTTLDPRFNIAYRLGAILLAEGYPSGAGNTAQAIALLEKGMREMPEKWQYPHDAGFVVYWWRRDPAAAAEWFLKAEKVPGAPNWLRPVAASMLTQGGARETAHELWRELATNGEHEWLRRAGRRGLMQLDAEAQIDVLQLLVERFRTRAGRFPQSWEELVAVGLLRQPPADPSGSGYTLDPTSGTVDVATSSLLYPLRQKGSGG
jgi:hypothetical protein